MKKILSVLGASTFSTLITCLQAHACSCVAMPLKQSIPLYNCIITGSFIQGDKLWEISDTTNNAATLYYTGKFVISKVLKANNIQNGDTVIISSNHSNCSKLFKNNSSYILFAIAKEEKLFTSICSYSGLLNDKKNRKILRQTEQFLNNNPANNQSNN